MFGDDFKFNYCPECGSNKVEPLHVTFGSGHGRFCPNCDMAFHAIRHWIQAGQVESDNQPVEVK